MFLDDLSVVGPRAALDIGRHAGLSPPSAENVPIRESSLVAGGGRSFIMVHTILALNPVIRELPCQCELIHQTCIVSSRTNPAAQSVRMSAFGWQLKQVASGGDGSRFKIGENWRCAGVHDHQIGCLCRQNC